MPREMRTRKRRNVRKLLIERQGLICFYCGRELILPAEYMSHQKMKERGVATVEHLRSLSEGGTNELSNLVLSCVACQEERHNGGSDGGTGKE